jgi:hypothetical protein
MPDDSEIIATGEAEFTLTPDGADTIVHAIIRPGTHELEFVIATADKETMNAAAEAYLQEWVQRNAKQVFGHQLN